MNSGEGMVVFSVWPQKEKKSKAHKICTQCSGPHTNRFVIMFISVQPFIENLIDRNLSKDLFIY